jgi:hypothetical protein
MLSSGFHLTIMIGGQPALREVIESLTSVSVTKKAGDRSGFQLVFNVSKFGAIQTSLLPSGYFSPITTRVQIVVSMGGTSTVLMDGLIARHDMAPSDEPGKSTLTITGEDISLALDLIDLSGLIYPCCPPEARVALNLIPLAGFGTIPEIIPSVMIDIPNPLERFPMHTGTSLAYIKSMAAAVGYVFYVDMVSLGVNRAYWGPEIRWGSVQPALSINSDGSSNVESLSFSFDGLSGTLFYFEVQVPFTCFAIPIPVPSVGLLRPPLAAKPALPLRLEKIEDTMKLGPIRGALVALAKAAQGNDAVTGQGTLNVLRYGRILETRSLVDVRGSGNAYDGTYFVKSVTHNIKRGEYKQSFSLVREGIVPLQQRVTV